MQETVLAKILDGVWSQHGFNNAIYLLIYPHDQLKVYAGELTKKQFDSLREQSAFITLHKFEGDQLQHIKEIITPYFSSGYRYAV